MIALFKALFPGVILTLVVSLLIGSTGSHGGFVHIFHTEIYGQGFYWSWPLFVAGTLTSWGILAMMQ